MNKEWKKTTAAMAREAMGKNSSKSALDRFASRVEIDGAKKKLFLLPNATKTTKVLVEACALWAACQETADFLDEWDILRGDGRVADMKLPLFREEAEVLAEYLDHHGWELTEEEEFGEETAEKDPEEERRDGILLGLTDRVKMSLEMTG